MVENSDLQQTLSECCLVLNSKIHTCIDSMINQDVVKPHSIEDVNIDEFVHNLDSDVWKVICFLTQSRTIKGIDTSTINYS